MVENGQRIRFWMHDWRLGVLHDKFTTLFTFTTQRHATLHTVVIGENNWNLKIWIVSISDGKSAQKHRGDGGIADRANKWREPTCMEMDINRHFFMLNPHTRSLNTHPLFRIFGWIMTLNRILTIDNIMKRGIEVVNRCVLWKRALETIQHLVGDYGTTTFTGIECLPGKRTRYQRNHNDPLHWLYGSYFGDRDVPEFSKMKKTWYIIAEEGTGPMELHMEDIETLVTNW